MHPASPLLCFSSLNFSTLHKVGASRLSLSVTYRFSAFCVLFEFLHKLTEVVSHRGRGRQAEGQMVGVKESVKLHLCYENGSRWAQLSVLSVQPRHVEERREEVDV